MKIGAVIVAAGMSERMRRFRELMEIGNLTMAERTVTSFQRAGADRIVAHPGADGGRDGARPSRRGIGREGPRPSQTLVVAIGPEGGWTDDEVAQLEAKGFRRHSLGERILRTDTATIAVIAQLMAAKGI